MNKRDVRQHRHILRRATRATYSCIDDCSYREVKAYLLGRIVRCPYCREEFQLTLEDLKRALPRCPKCSNTKTKRVTSELESIFQDANDAIPEQTTLFEEDAEENEEDENLKKEVGF